MTSHVLYQLKALIIKQCDARLHSFCALWQSAALQARPVDRYMWSDATEWWVYLSRDERQKNANYKEIHHNCTTCCPGAELLYMQMSNAVRDLIAHRRQTVNMKTDESKASILLDKLKERILFLEAYIGYFHRKLHSCVRGAKQARALVCIFQAQSMKATRISVCRFPSYSIPPT